MKLTCQVPRTKVWSVILIALCGLMIYSCERDNQVDDDALKSVTIINGSETQAIDRGETIELTVEVNPASFELQDNQISLLNGDEDLRITGLEGLGGGNYVVYIEDKDNGIPYSKQVALSVSYTQSGEQKTVKSNTVTVAYTPQEYTYTMMNNETVYDAGNHAAFTGLVNYKGVLYLAFREGSAHRPVSVEDYGVIKVLSKSGTGWTEVATIRDETKDLRDPFLIEVDGKLRVYIGYNTFEGERYQHSGSVYADFENGSWSGVKELHHDVPHIVWLWKVRKFKNVFYSVAYLEGEYPALLSSDDGVNWHTVTLFELEGELSEADMCFVGNTMYVCLRKDKPTGTPSFWGYAHYPFADFTWTQMTTCIESPAMLRLPYSEHILVAGRERNPSLGEVNVSLFSATLSGDLTRVATIEPGTGGDKGYPGLVVKDNLIWCSYYSGISTAASIKMATFNFE